MRYFRWISLLFAAALILGCAPQKTYTIRGSLIAGEGTVKFVSTEGGYYAIVTDDGKTYEPLNLYPDFKINGLRIRFKGKVRRDVASFRMRGQAVELFLIERI